MNSPSPDHGSTRTKTKSKSKGRNRVARAGAIRKLANEAIDTFSASDLQSKEFPELRYAVDGYIAEGVTLLVGKPKIGKSWMALDLAVAVATGGLALHSIKCTQGSVLYFALEDNQRRLQRRMRELFGDTGKWPPDLHIALDAKRLNEGLIEDLDVWISAYKPALVIIDTFAKVRPVGGRDGGYEADYAALSPLQELAGERGVSILLVHHLRKMGAEDQFDMISGSTGLTGAVDAALILLRGQQGVTLYGRGREIEEIEHAVEFEQGRWRVLGDAAEVRRSQERSAILAILADAVEPMGPKEIADALGKPENNTKQLLHKMLKDGEINKLERGKYSVVSNQK